MRSSQFKHEDGFFLRAQQETLIKITRRKQQKRSAPADDVELKAPKVAKVSHESTPSTPMSPPLHSSDSLSPLLSDQSPTSPDSPTSIQNYLVNELNSLKRKNLTQENTMAWLIQEVIKSKKEIDELKKTVKQLASDNDEHKRRQALEVIGIRQQQLQSSYVRPEAAFQQNLPQHAQLQQSQSHMVSLPQHLPQHPVQNAVLVQDSAYGYPTPGHSTHQMQEADADQFLFGGQINQSGHLQADSLFY